MLKVKGSWQIGRRGINKKGESSMTINQETHLESRIEAGIMHLTLNRPESLNAFSPDMMARLKEALQTAKRRRSGSCHCLIRSRSCI